MAFAQHYVNIPSMREYRDANRTPQRSRKGLGLLETIIRGSGDYNRAHEERLARLNREAAGDKYRQDMLGLQKERFAWEKEKDARRRAAAEGKEYVPEGGRGGATLTGDAAVMAAGGGGMAPQGAAGLAPGQGGQASSTGGITQEELDSIVTRLQESGAPMEQWMAVREGGIDALRDVSGSGPNTPFSTLAAAAYGDMPGISNTLAEYEEKGELQRAMGMQPAQQGRPSVPMPTQGATASGGPERDIELEELARLTGTGEDTDPDSFWNTAGRVFGARRDIGNIPMYGDENAPRMTKDELKVSLGLQAPAGTAPAPAAAGPSALDQIGQSMMRLGKYNADPNQMLQAQNLIGPGAKMERQASNMRSAMEVAGPELESIPAIDPNNPGSKAVAEVSARSAFQSMQASNVPPDTARQMIKMRMKADLGQLNSLDARKASYLIDDIVNRLQ